MKRVKLSINDVEEYYHEKYGKVINQTYENYDKLIVKKINAINKKLKKNWNKYIHDGKTPEEILTDILSDDEPSN